MACSLKNPRKLERDKNNLSDEKLEYISKGDFRNLPDLALIKIFNMLNFEDRCNVKFVCHRWYNVSRSSAVWIDVNIEVKSSLQLLKSILVLPSSVTILYIKCDFLDQGHPLWLPDILTRLHKRCPNLKTLIIERIFFSSRFCNVRLTTDHVLQHSFETGEEKTNLRYTQRCTKECCSEVNNVKNYIPENRPQQLDIFSLRFTDSYLSHFSSKISLFLPKVRVLDLTSSINFKPAAIPFFLNLQYLEELYLVRCKINNIALEALLKHMKCLKVLDLEGCREVDDQSFAIICNHGGLLQELYLGNTCIEEFPLCSTFHNLQTLCLKNLDMDFVSLFEYLVGVPSINCVNISSVDDYPIFYRIRAALYDKYGKEVINYIPGNPHSICHHFQSKYR